MSDRGRGLFITFEGIEGSGKSTQISRVAARLRSAGVQPVLTREPGGTELGRQLRSLLLSRDAPSIGALTELLLYVTDRAQHLEELVLPALSRGRLVLCDRYLDATLAYQGFGRGLGVERILGFHHEPPLDLRPDRTIVLDLEASIGLGRARERNRVSGLEAAEGRFEDEQLAFHERVRSGYLALAEAEPERFRVVAADGDPDAVERRINDELADLVLPRGDA